VNAGVEWLGTVDLTALLIAAASLIYQPQVFCDILVSETAAGIKATVPASHSTLLTEALYNVLNSIRRK